MAAEGTTNDTGGSSVITPRRDSAVLQTADRALQVLLAFRSRPEWGVSELARELGLDKSVTQRLLSTLARRGFVLADPESRRYRLGATISVLARAAEQGGVLESTARPVLAALARRIGESATLNVPHGGAYRCAVAVDADGPVRYSATVGQTIPAHGGAGGHAIFAFYPEEEIRRLVGDGPLPRFSEHTIVDPGELTDTYARVRETGVAISHGEYDANVISVAAPCFVLGQVVASIAIIGPHDRMAAKVDDAVELVREGTARLEALLGGTG
ncbi:IclR family transcriptional regulator [Thermasporomyces composti]|jgi:IclR family acetate operon transcriptional repressor|uniref:IclR family transcriptional regulator n=1 Tax=Thermasporomyces composti TaxID=696763 RepID=A0A3D9V0J0_THECX|nr:IclR family transcriptional regulator [Thermasporomyces composti]REF35037.1 IclR family transcriptional regulator [Thermasporomyces composti]